MNKPATEQTGGLGTWTHVEPVLTTGLLALTALPFVYCAAFTGAKVFDDEGALMITFRDILDGRILYHDIFALYGPFYYFSFTPIFSLLNVPLSHDAARLISAFFWLCSSLIFAALSWRLTGSAIAKAFTFLTVLFLLKVFVHSPLHPQELSFLLVGIALHLLVSIEKESKPVTLILLGAIAGALLFTKVNLAAFVILPLFLGALRATEGHAYLRAMHGVVLALAVLIPVVLMAPLFHLEWAVRYCIFASGTIVAALVVWSSSFIPKVLTVRHWGLCAGGFTAAVLVALGATMVGGTTAFEIFRATILQNFGLVQNWNRPASVGGGALTVTAISLVYAVLYARSRTRANREAILGRVMRLKAGIGILGCLAIAGAVIFSIPWEDLPPIMFQFLVPFAWLLMVTDETAKQPRPLARGVLGLLAAFLILYAFPIEGTQTVLAALLPASMLPVLLHDAVRHPETRRLLKELLTAVLRVAVWRRMPVAAAYALMLVMLGSQTASEVRRYQSLESLNLPGAYLVRIDHDDAQLLRGVVAELVTCPAFYSLPNLPSLYFWTNQRAPTGMISNNTLGLLSPDQQWQTIADLERHAELCILTIPALLRYFDRGQLATRPPLLRYIEENFVEKQSNGPFHLLRRKGA